jgi:hypothetical protein
MISQIKNNEMKSLQKELNAIAKLKMITGDVFLVAEIKAKDYLELDKMSNEILSELETPIGFKKSENLFYNGKIDIYISFTKK